MSIFLKDKDKIADWLDSMGVNKYVINDDLTVDVNTHVFLSYKNLLTIPVKFNTVYGDFDVSYNAIRDLIGSPNRVMKSFYGFQCQLDTLEGAPSYVGNHFQVHINKLTSLKHFPQTVLGEIDVSENELTSMKYLPNTVGSIYLACNYISSFEGLPENIKGNLTIFDNKIESFEGITQKHQITGYIDCDFLPQEEDSRAGFEKYKEILRIKEYDNIIDEVSTKSQVKNKIRL